jgi:hypothetical protein
MFRLYSGSSKLETPVCTSVCEWMRWTTSNPGRPQIYREKGTPYNWDETVKASQKLTLH